MQSVHVSTHPLVAHHVCTLRNPATQPSEFRRVVRQLAALVAVEATAGLPTHRVRAPTPLGEAAGRMLADAGRWRLRARIEARVRRFQAE